MSQGTGFLGILYAHIKKAVQLSETILAIVRSNSLGERADSLLVNIKDNLKNIRTALEVRRYKQSQQSVQIALEDTSQAVNIFTTSTSTGAVEARDTALVLQEECAKIEDAFNNLIREYRERLSRRGAA